MAGTESISSWLKTPARAVMSAICALSAAVAVEIIALIL
jgi:hypothetical protein